MKIEAMRHKLITNLSSSHVFTFTPGPLQGNFGELSVGGNSEIRKTLLKFINVSGDGPQQLISTFFARGLGDIRNIRRTYPFQRKYLIIRKYSIHSMGHFILNYCLGPVDKFLSRNLKLDYCSLTKNTT